MRERVDDDVDADWVALFDGEFFEVFVVLAFFFPAVGDVGVVGHEDHEAAVVIEDSAEVGFGGFESSF